MSGSNTDVKLDLILTALGGGTAGPLAPGASLSTVQARASAMCTWQITVTNSPALLVPAWATGAAKKKGEPVIANGNVYRCITAGTTAGSGTGPSTTSADITDNTAHWAYVGSTTTAFAGGFSMVNIDASNPIYYGIDSGITTSAASAPLPKNGGGIALNFSPALIYAVSGGSVVIGLTALV